MSEAEVLSIVAADGYHLACRRYAPSDGHRRLGLVVYLHGIQSHGGWYDASSRRLAEAGFTVYLPDRRGSGLNAADRGHGESWEQLAADMVAVESRALAEAAEAAVRLPLMLVGVSWGGKLAAALAAMHGGRYAALALLCPGICPQRDVSLGTKLRIAAALAGKRGRQRFPIPLDDPGLFTATPRWLEFLARDRLTLHEATARFLFESRRLDATVAAMAPWIRVPTWLALAGRDRIIDNDRTLAWLCRLGASERTARLYPTAHHTLEFEPQCEAIFDDLATWLADQAERHISKATRL